MGLYFDPDTFVNLPKMKQGGVTAIVSVYYLPEAELADGLHKFPDETFLDLVFRLSGKTLKDIVEDQSTSDAAFAQIKDYIKKFVEDIQAAPARGFPNVGIPKDFSQFEEMISQGKTVFLHSIEGAHCLGSKNEVKYDVLRPRLKELFDLGVCQFTLAHFFENVMVSSQGGIPPDIANLIHYNPKNIYPNGYNEADNIAVQLVDQMLDLGIIIDLVHCTPGTKAMVYARNKARGKKKRPLVFSHTGVQRVALEHTPHMPTNDKLYLPDDGDIREVRESGGVLGVIFMDYWLNGRENVAPAISTILDTIQHIREVCGDYENISIGSDLDGFTEVPRDLAGENHMVDLVRAMKGNGIADRDIQKMAFENYRRVLKNGWGN
jgi:microsomal dipeptidase-like Zn-dependent dipeptidase